MVLYKRKTISLPPPNPLPRNLNIKIWYIKETGEWFTKYLEFLERLAFYNRHLFTCEITGTSCLTFFEALNSEESQFQYVEKMFPIKLREPVAKFIHFNDIRRLDLLVEQVYSKFKNDYFPGEFVYLRKSKIDVKNAIDEQGQNSAVYQKPYIIKEKAQFNAILDKSSNDEIVPASVKYMLQEAHGPASCVADESHIYRERSSFTKHLIKCFCKITLKRASSKMGAPWCVRDEYIPIYNISRVWPESMLKYREDYIDPQQLAEEKQRESLKRELERNRSETPDLKRVKAEEISTDASPASEETEKATAINEVVQPIAQIMEDLNLPLLAPRNPRFNEKLLSYSEDYVAAPSDQAGLGAQSIDKCLHCYQFLITFRETLHISEFTWDNFVNSLRFTNPRQIMDEYVTITLRDGSNECVKRPNLWNNSVYDYIDSFNSDKMSINVELDEEINDDYLDEVKLTGASLIVECFCALLRLFIDSDGNWTTTVADEWFNEAGQEDGDDTEKASENHLTDTDLLLEKCLNYRKVEWTDRLIKREFNNGFWLIILLGVLQDCIHIPIYTKSIKEFIEKLVPCGQTSNSLPLNKLLWRRFCKDVSLESKVTIMWILVELLTNYSSIIKSSMDDAMDLCSHIRSERFKLNRDIKMSMAAVSELKDNISSLTSKDTIDNEELKNMKERLSEAETEVSRLTKRKSFLDAKLTEVDAQRLKPIGLDRYGNKIFWLESYGVPRTDSKSSVSYLGGRIWIQGPSPEAAALYLKITKEELDCWEHISRTKGKTEATRAVFHVYRDSNGSYVYEDEHGSVLLVNAEGEYNSIIELSSIQKKIIDETPERLLLLSSNWTFLDDIQQVDELCDWLDNWGKREHETLKQLQNFRNTIECSFSSRQTAKDSPQADDASKIMAEIASMQLTEREMNVDNLQVEDVETEIEEELDSIAHQIMTLDDSSKTRKVLEKITQLEAHRDELLSKKKSLDELNTEKGSEKVSRPKIRALRASRDRKLGVLKENFDKLLNLKREQERVDITSWSNQAAISIWSSELFKCSGSSKSSKDPENVSVTETFVDILKQATVLETEGT